MNQTLRNCRLLPCWCLCAVLFFVSAVYAQETTGGLQGTVTDPSGAVVAHAQVVLTGTSLVGTRDVQTDGNGYYHFTNLPPGDYTLTVSAKGFKTLKRGSLTVEVGHLPTLDLKLDVGASETVVEVSEAAPVIDVTTTHTINNITQDVIQDVPHGRSFQSVIQFAPAARNEPLAGNNTFYGAGTGGSSQSSSSNGQAFGYSVGGAADSENSYLVEGQDTSNIAGGYSMANVPFEFIQEVQVKSSGIEAEHGGALGGVVNVVMKKGSNAFHGQLFGTWEGDPLDATPSINGGGNAFPIYNPLSLGASGDQVDAISDRYQPKGDHFRIMQVGGTLGGALIKDRLFFFMGFEPQVNTLRRVVNFTGPANPGAGLTPFNQTDDTYFGTARLDAALSQKIHVFASWLYQYQRETGSIFPFPDSTTGLINPSVSSPVNNFQGGAGFTAPNQTINVGGDIAITPQLVSTTRFGYFIQDYHDFGFPTGFPAYNFINSGVGAVDSSGNPIPATSPLSQPSGYASANFNFNYTPFNLNRHYQFDQDLAWFKSGWWGTHNFKFGYQLNHLYNDVLQRSNLPLVFVSPGVANAYTPVSATGVKNCALLNQETGLSNCNGPDGYAYVYDTGTDGKASNYNHGLFAQDAWTVARGLTLDLGIRFDKEYLPAYQVFEGLTPKPINFSWTDKVAPRIGAAYDVFKDGRMKVFGSYGVYYDMMKLNLAISSFGGQYWNECVYGLFSDGANALSQIDPVYNSSGRACSGLNSSLGANFASGSQPADVQFIENGNYRTPEYVAPNIKPYRQHDTTFGIDYQIQKTWALEARWDRRRLDRAIEDASVFDLAAGNEVYTIINPGYAPNNTFNGYAQFDLALNDRLFGCTTPGSCPTGANGALTNPAAIAPVLCASCPNPVKAARSYDGVEIRLTKSASAHWSGMFSYTYSHLRGNYSGLTSTDISDSSTLAGTGTSYGGGRNAPNNSRYFDEPYFSFTSNGTPDNGPLPTDRPNVFKGYAYYQLPWKWKENSTNFGLFQYLYQGSPISTFSNVGLYAAGLGGEFQQYVVGRGNWIDASQDSTCVAAALAGGTTDCPITIGGITARRTPWYIQSDFQVQHEIKFGAEEAKSIRFEFTVPNIFNQHSVTAYESQLDSSLLSSFIQPGGHSLLDEGAFYAAAMHPYNLQSAINQPNILGSPGVIMSSNYGKPLYYQVGRTVRMAVRFTF